MKEVCKGCGKESDLKIYLNDHLEEDPVQCKESYDLCKKCNQNIDFMGPCGCHEQLCNNCCAKQHELELRRMLRKMGLPQTRSVKLRKAKLQNMIN